MGLPRMREEQVAELNQRTQLIIAEAKIPRFCNEDCEEFNPSCAAAWILETISEANRLERLEQTYDEVQTRRLNSEIRLIPHLHKRAVECGVKVAWKVGPIEVDLVDLVASIDSSYRPGEK